jgi:hypothetical protein
VPNEEERRLFYVAVTRAQVELNLTYDASEPVSPFLAEADAEDVIATCNRMRRVVSATLHSEADSTASSGTESSGTESSGAESPGKASPGGSSSTGSPSPKRRDRISPALGGDGSPTDAELTDTKLTDTKLTDAGFTDAGLEEGNPKGNPKEGSGGPSFADNDLVAFCMGAETLHLGRYFERWWDADDAYKAALARRLQATDTLEAQAQAEMEAYEAAIAARKNAIARQKKRKRRARTAAPPGKAGAGKAGDEVEVPVALRPGASPSKRGVYTFARQGEHIRVRSKSRVVGRVAPERGKHALDDLVATADWSQAKGRFVRLSNSGKTVYLATRFTSGRNASSGGNEQADEDDETALQEPEAPTSITRQVLSSSFQRGKAFVMRLLGS